MAFPTIPTVAAGRVLTANQLNTTATRTFPAFSGLTFSAGDRLIAIVIGYQSSTTNAQFSSWSHSFNERHDSGTSTTLAIGIAEKIADGTESGSLTVTQAATITGDASMILLAIPGAHASTASEVSARADGTGSAADPASFNPGGWDAEDTLWISVVGSGMTSGTGSWTATGTTAPSNYGDRVDTNASDTSTIGDVEAAVAFRQLNAASEDVGTAGVDTSNARNSAVVIAVRPAPTVNQGSASGAVSWDGSATGATVRSGSGAGAVGWAGSATGTTVRSGAASGAVDWDGSATGEAPIPPNEGSASGAVSWDGTATGAATHQGAASGAVTWDGTAAGITDREGSATGAVTWDGTAAGITDREGTAGGAVSWDGTSTGTTTRAGEATGAVTWDGAATGDASLQGEATGAVTWAGSATGESPAVGVNDGSAEGAITWTGSATGSAVHSGDAAGAVGWAGSATGQAPSLDDQEGSAAGTITWDGSATGRASHEGSATGTITWAGSATSLVAADQTVVVGELSTNWSPGGLQHGWAPDTLHREWSTGRLRKT